MGTLFQRVPRERRPPLPGRGIAPRVRHAGMRQPLRRRAPRQGRGADPRGPVEGGRTAPRRRRDSWSDLPVQEQHGFRRQLVRLSRELSRRTSGRLPADHRHVDPVLRHPPDLFRRRQVAADGTGDGVLSRPARRAHLGGHLVGDHPEPPHHQHQRRAARRRRALSASPRHRRRFEHVGVHDVRQGRHDRGAAPDARGRRRVP